MPSMLRSNAYDTVCHEHLEYYSLGDRRSGSSTRRTCELVDVRFNRVNGGSFAVTAAHSGVAIKPRQRARSTGSSRRSAWASTRRGPSASSRSASSSTATDLVG